MILFRQARSSAAWARRSPRTCAAAKSAAAEASLPIGLGRPLPRRLRSIRGQFTAAGERRAGSAKGWWAGGLMEGRQVIDKQKWRANKGGLSEEQLTAEFEIQRALRPAPRAPRITEGVRRPAQGAHAAGSATRCMSMRPRRRLYGAHRDACVHAARRGHARGVGHALRVSRTPTRTRRGHDAVRARPVPGCFGHVSRDRRATLTRRMRRSRVAPHAPPARAPAARRGTSPPVTSLRLGVVCARASRPSSGVAWREGRETVCGMPGAPS